MWRSSEDTLPFRPPLSGADPPPSLAPPPPNRPAPRPEPVPLPLPPACLLVGRWRVEFANGVTEAGEIGKSGAAFPPPQRSQAGDPQAQQADDQARRFGALP